MKKALNFSLLAVFQLGYLEWGHGNKLFIFQGEAEVLRKALVTPMEVLHPFILIPFFGQLLLLCTLFQKEPRRWMTLTGVACLSTLMLLLLVIGVIIPNVKILAAAIPFLVVASVVVRQNWKRPAIQ